MTASASVAEATADSRNRRPKKARAEGARRERKAPDVASLRDWLASLELGVKPSIHINGHAFPMALVTVDFGTPLKPIKLTTEQVQELNERLRKLAREVLIREANVRVVHDSTNGIFFASIA